MTQASPTGTTGQPGLANPAFVEVQFPVSKLSKESFTERVSVAGQTLTALGKWWGRKPLVLVRAIILGLLLPATGDAARDREVFLKLMTMDDEGLWRRARERGSIPQRVVHERCTPGERASFFRPDDGKPRWKKGLPAADKLSLQRRAFLRMTYDEKLAHCVRPEEIDGPDAASWVAINAHLGTSARTLPELVRELGQRRFGRVPRLGDAFCGGGSIPFEAARLGCEASGSDLNPVAALLTWAALRIVGGGPEVVGKVRAAQRRVYEAMRRQVEEWGIERREDGWVADAYLYCNEVLDPATGWWVPLAPSWVIGEGTRTVARLVPDRATRRFAIEIHQGVSDEEVRQAREEGTWQDGVGCPVDRNGNRVPPSLRQTTSFEQLLGRGGLRPWENGDLIPRPDDVFQERLYCVRWVDPDPESGAREYCAPTETDLGRERRVLELLGERFEGWQARGYIPSRRIEPGESNTRPIRGRGWTHWHHLFNPRQLLLGGLLAEMSETMGSDVVERVGLLLLAGRHADWSSRLSRWHPHGANEKGEQTFYNPSLNTPLVNYTCRPMQALDPVVRVDLVDTTAFGATTVVLGDARETDRMADLWITDPGYADKVSYAELSEFFLAWYERRVPGLFPGWYVDSKRALAVEGAGDDFRAVMAECYQNLARHMPPDGFQVVMFTHQDPEVWADLALVLWAAGLRVTAAWTIATETSAVGIKQGNYVQGTVVLVLRKRMGEERAMMTDIYPDLRAEIQRQIQSMRELDDRDNPNFGDADYQLAAYAAALRILTAYGGIEDVDIARELRRGRGERSELATLIGRAVQMVSEFLVPDGLDPGVWRNLSPEERFYLKGVEVEAHGEYRDGVYQEFARSFGIREYRSLLATGAANQVRLRTPGELAARNLERKGEKANGGRGEELSPSSRFAISPLRRVLYAIYATATHPERDPHGALQYLHQEVEGYWEQRQKMVGLLRFLEQKPKPEGGMPHWAADVAAARVLRGLVEHDHR